MLYLAIHMFIASEIQNDRSFSAQFQGQLMVNLFSTDVKQKFHRPIIEDLCGKNHITSWWHVTCQGQVAVAISVMSTDAPTFKMAFVPPTIREISVEQSVQEYELQTRNLPRDLQFFHCRINRIHGRPELDCLPRRLAYMMLSRNHLSGPIYLLNLPSTLEVLSLENNDIKQHTVYYSDLPKKLQKVCLAFNAIDRITVVNGNVDSKDKRLFPLMKGKVF